MIVSSAFNRKFHATLGDVIASNKKITINEDSIKLSIDTKKIDINGIKIIFKLLDDNYPKDKKGECHSTSYKLNRLYDIFGCPKSISEITAPELSEHLLWIQSICAENNIKIHDDVWDALLKKAEESGY